MDDVMPSDIEIMNAMANRDESALQLLYDRYSPFVLSICRRMLCDAAESEEVMIEVFWELWNRASRFDPARSAVFTYVSLLTRSRALDRVRSLEARPGKGGGRSDHADQRLEDPSLSPLGLLVTEEACRSVGSALDRIDPAYREVIEHAYYGGLSHAEIAVRLSRPLGTVKAYLRNGLRDLRQILSMAISE